MCTFQSASITLPYNGIGGRAADRRRCFFPFFCVPAED